MKLNIHHPVSARQSRDGLYHLFYPRGWIIIALLMFSALTIAQESTSEEFVIGATFDRGTRYGQYYYDKLREAGMNILSQYADETTNDFLDGLNFLAINNQFNYEWIYFYSTAYYSKWEAEEDQDHRYKVGFKHRERVDSSAILGTLIGSPDTLLGRQCWTTKGLTSPTCSLMYGPHYHQEKTYKRWPDTTIYPGYNKYDLKYTPRYTMALDVSDTTLSDTSSICRLSVVERYRWQVDGKHIGNDSDMVLKSIILKASDFQPYCTFKEFYLDDDTLWYEYPQEFRDPENGIGKRDFSHFLGLHFFDRWGDQGVQFKVDWLGDNSKCNLYIDYVEVYDNDGWNRYLANPQEVEDSIIAYAQRYPQSQWPNMEYWVGCDEPSSLDDYIPLKTVDSILESMGAPRLITTVYPWWEGEVNGESQLVRYYNTVQPAKLMIDFFPALPFRIPVGFEDWETTREMFQTCSSLQPGFWYQAQAAGVFSGGEWVGVRKPDSIEFKAQNMLALAHGVKGLIYWAFRSWGITRGIIDSSESSNGETSLYRELRDHFVPRLKGNLGKTLMKLDYTGNYLQLQRKENEESASPIDVDYLTLSPGIPEDLLYNWHCGFFDSTGHPEDKYFMLANLMTTGEKNIRLTIQAPDPYPINYKFRDVEGLFDTTIQASHSLLKQITYPPGEGHLYEFAPVIKYGGRLIYDDYAGDGITLNDDMIIENGATLTIYGDYSAKANIIVKNGSIINGENGKITFMDGTKLIIEGNAIISGAFEDKLDFEFTGQDADNGIVVNPGASLTISYCVVTGAETGVKAMVNSLSINIQNVDFIDCISTSINLLGQTGLQEIQRQISFCTITNSPFGISASNLP